MHYLADLSCVLMLYVCTIVSPKEFDIENKADEPKWNKMLQTFILSLNDIKMIQSSLTYGIYSDLKVSLHIFLVFIIYSSFMLEMR